jgi:hypothetical protein
MSVLDHFMGEVLADVDVLSTLTSADYVISPFDACRIIFVDGRVIGLLKSHILKQIAKVNDFDRNLGSCIIFSFCR